MKKMVLSLMMALSCGSALADVIGFDDLPGNEQLVAGGYQGFGWTNIATVAADAFPGSGYAAGTVSGANSAFNYDGGTAAISRAGAFDFGGAYFTSAWYDQEISFEGWRNGQLVYSSALSTVIDTITPLWVELGWTGIDTLMIYNSSGTPWAMDDFTYSAAEVPEPASVALFGLSLAGLLAARRRKQAR